jgi:hypothetical protein
MSFVINPYRFGTVATFNPATDTLTDTVTLDGGIVQFLYAGAGESPGGDARVDEISLGADIVGFSYTT